MNKLSLFIVVSLCQVSFAQDSNEGTPELPSSTSKAGAIVIYKTVSEEITTYVKKHEWRQCYNRRRRCWYWECVEVKVPVKKLIKKNVASQVLIPPVRDIPGAAQLDTSFEITAPNSAGVIDDLVAGRIRDVFPESKYDLVRVNVQKNKDTLIDFRSRSVKNNEKVQVVVQIDPSNKKKVTINAFGINQVNSSKSGDAAQKALDFANKAVQE